MTMQPLLAYLDHNVLDRMSKGDPDRIRQFLQERSLTVAFSTENLDEIRRSRGYEETFLNLLESLGALYIVPTQDETWNYSGVVEILSIKASDAYRLHLENCNPLPEYGFGLSGVLEKLYGGRQDLSYEQILSNGTEELNQLLLEASRDLPSISDEDRKKVEEAMSAVLEAVHDRQKQLGDMLDSTLGHRAAVNGQKWTHSVRQRDK